VDREHLAEGENVLHGQTPSTGSDGRNIPSIARQDAAAPVA
jgi:hypothetical protein